MANNDTEINNQSPEEDGKFEDLEAGETTSLLTQNKTPQRSNLREKVVKGATVVATTTSVLTVVTMGANPLTIVSGGIGAILAPLAARQENKITELEALKEVNESMGQEVNILAKENERLLKQVEKFEKSLSHMEEMEQALEAINKTETQSVDEMEKQLDKSKQILGSMEESMKATVLQNIVSVALRSDLDGDQTLDDDEIDLLLKKIDAYNTVQVDKDAFKKTMESEGRSLSAIMGLIRHILSDDIPEEEKIIRISDA